MNNRSFDTIIVGQGIAGSALAMQFHLKGKKVLIIDKHHERCASKAAIGVHNPLIIKRLRKSWRAAELIAYARHFYQNCGTVLGTQIHRDTEIHRIFANDNEAALWNEKSLMEAWKEYIALSSIRSHQKETETGLVKMGGWLNVPLFLEKVKDFFHASGQYKSIEFDHTKIEVLDDSVRFDDIDAKQIIFCEGLAVLKNPFFSTLPLRGLKGEIIRIKDPDLKVEKILKLPHYLVPLGNDEYKIGATFDHESLDDSVSKEARETLLKSVEAYRSHKLEVIDQVSGLRPTVKDRRPLIGRHAEFQRLYVFNGMGTRGITLAPFFSEELFNYINHNHPLDEEVNIRRFN